MDITHDKRCYSRQRNSIPDALHWNGDRFVLLKVDCSQIGCRHFLEENIRHNSTNVLLIDLDNTYSVIYLFRILYIPKFSIIRTNCLVRRYFTISDLKNYPVYSESCTFRIPNIKSSPLSTLLLNLTPCIPIKTS